jgi:hypothetical protein
MKTVLKRVAKALLPKPALKGIQQWRSRRVDAAFAALTPEQSFERIYAEGLCGVGEDGRGSSGDGSHQAGVVKPYIGAVVAFLRSLERPLCLVDLGCGDFAVGQHVAPAVDTYVGCDIVASVIEENQRRWGSPSIDFVQLNLIDDALPAGRVATLRQVLQHLSNAQIAKILPKLSIYDHVIITEHVPAGEFRVNVDKPNGPGTRLSRSSGVVVGREPFGMPGFSPQTLLEVEGNGELISTTVWSRD